MRRFLAVDLCLLSMLVGCGPGVDAAKATVLACVGEDPRTPKSASKRDLIAALEVLTSMDIETGRHTIHPWCLDSYSVGDVRWVLLEVYEGLNVPDMSAARVHAFDANWNHLFAQVFPTGYRHSVVDAQMQPESVLGIPLIRISVMCTGPFLVVPGRESVPAFSTPGTINEFYAVRRDRVVMVRLEDHERRAMGPSYAWKAPVMGPEIRSRTSDQVAQSLELEDPVDVLETLLWLSGRHFESSKLRSENASQESVEHAKLFESVQNRADVHDRLVVLKSSDNPWIREYAVLSLRER